MPTLSPFIWISYNQILYGEVVRHEVLLPGLENLQYTRRTSGNLYLERLDTDGEYYHHLTTIRRLEPRVVKWLTDKQKMSTQSQSAGTGPTGGMVLPQERQQNHPPQAPPLQNLNQIVRSPYSFTIALCCIKWRPSTWCVAHDCRCWRTPIAWECSDHRILFCQS